VKPGAASASVARILEIDGQPLEVTTVGPAEGDAPPLVFLHEGLGSVAMWRDFPAALCARTGSRGIVYSRHGYGASAPLCTARAAGYMHREAQCVLPLLLAALGAESPVLVGHSDGASIALIHAGSGFAPLRGVVAMAPHLFNEPLSVASIAAAKVAYETAGLRERLARYHADVDSAFRGWNDIWLHPDFRHWNIEEYAARIECPILAIQGYDDEYGTLAQLDALAALARGPFAQRRLPDCRHSPHRDRTAETLSAIERFVAGLRAPPGPAAAVPAAR